MQYKKTLYLILFISCFLLNSCLDEYKVALNQKTEQLVVEALITDEPSIPQIKLSLTEQFGTANSYKPVRGAFVQITDNEGKTILFQAVPTLLGIYRSNDLNFRGIVGKSYKLTIKLTDGRTYESTVEPMLSPVFISKLSASFVNPGIEGKYGQIGYQVYADVEDPKNIENYYRWTAWGVYKRKSAGVPCNFNSICNDLCWVKEENFAANLFSDNGTDGNLLRKRPVFLSPFYYYGKHYIEVKQHTISRRAYQFWERFQQQNQRSGSIFDPIPAPVVGNVSNVNNSADIALGFFEVASISKKRIEIPGDTLVGKVNYDKLLVPAGDCSRAFPLSVYDKFPPPGW
jgi:Domain of unknown function (DUF4249)